MQGTRTSWPKAGTRVGRGFAGWARYLNESASSHEAETVTSELPLPGLDLNGPGVFSCSQQPGQSSVSPQGEQEGVLMHLVCNLQFYGLRVSREKRRGLFVCTPLQETQLRGLRGSPGRSSPRAATSLPPGRAGGQQGRLRPTAPTGASQEVSRPKERAGTRGTNWPWVRSRRLVGLRLIRGKDWKRGLCLAEVTLSQFIFEFESNEADRV